MPLRQRLSTLVVLALGVGVVQLVALAAPAQAYATPVGDWPSTQSPALINDRDGQFNPDDALELVAYRNDSGVQLLNTTNGSKRLVVAKGGQYGWSTRGVVSGDGSTVVAQHGPDRGQYALPGNQITVLRGFDRETLQGGTTTLFTTVPADRTVETMALSHDGSRLAFGGEGVSVLDTTTGAYTEVLPATGCASGNTYASHKVALSNDGNTLADYVGKSCNGGVTQARVWDIADPAHPVLLWSHDAQSEYSLPLFCSQAIRPVSIVLSGDGTHVALTDHTFGELEPTDGYNHNRGAILVRDLVNGTERTWFGQPGNESARICAIDMSEDGSRLAFEAAEKHQTSDSGWWGEEIWVTDTTSGATPVQVAEKNYDDGNFGWALSGLSADGNAVHFTGKSRNPGFPITLWTSRDPATQALAWPSGSALTAGQVAQTFVELQWPAATGNVSSYRITGGPAGPVDVPAGQTSVTISGLTAGTTYHFEVRARSGATSTDPLALDATTAAPTGPGTAALSATVTADDTVRLQWDPKAGVTGYEVMRSLGAGTAEKVADVPSGTTQWIDETTLGATSYTYRVAAVTGGTPAAHTVDASVTTAPVAIASVTPVATQNLGNAVPGAPVTVRAVGQPHRTARASLAIQGTAAPAPVTLTETAPGRYDGTVTLPVGATHLDGVSVELSDAAGTGAGHVASRSSAVGLPVGAALNVHVSSTGFVGRIVASSASGGWSTTSPINLTGDLTRLIGVPPAADVSVGFLRTGDGTMIDGGSGIATASGQVVDLAHRTLSEPARLEIEAGSDAARALVEVRQPNSVRELRLDSTGAGALTGLDAGEVRISLVPSDAQSWEFQPMAPVVRLLAVGANTVEIPLDARRTASLDGAVLPSTPGVSIAGGTVTVVQERGKTSVTRTSRISAAGLYAVSDLTAGLPTSVSVTHRHARSADPLAVPVSAGANHADIPVPVIDRYYVSPTLTLRDADGSVSTDPVDFRTGAHMGATLTGPGTYVGGWGFGDGESIPIAGQPGDTVTLCANGYGSGYSRGCASVQLPATTAQAVALELELTSEGRGLVTFSLRDAAGSTDPAREVRLIATQGARVITLDTPVTDGLLSLTPGSWYVSVVEPETGQVLASRGLAVQSGDNDLGLLTLAPTGPFAGEGNGLVFSQQSATPGGALDLAVSWKAGSAVPTPAVRLELPPSVSADPALGVTVNGQPVVATLSGSTLRFPVPALAAGGTGHATVRLDVAGDADESAIAVTATMEATGFHTMGVAAVPLPAVTIEAPQRVASHTITVFGRVRADAPVEILAGGVMVGSATGSASGSWRAEVTLPPGGEHVVVARSGDQQSDSVTVVVDRFAPTFTSVTVSQPGVRAVTRAPGASYPFVVVPNRAMTVTAEMADASRLTSADVMIDGVAHPMTRSNNKWEATFLAGLPRGEIEFRYVEAPLPTDLTLEQWAPPSLTLDEYLSSLPPAKAQDLGDPDVTLVEDERRARVSLPGGHLDITTFDATGTSTVGKRQVAQGVWVLSEPTLNASGDTVSGSVTLLVHDPSVPSPRGAARRIPPGVVPETGVEIAWLVGTTGLAGYETWGAKDKYKKLDSLLRQIAGCSQSSFDNFKPQLDKLVKEAIATDVASAAMQVAGLVLAPETFGIGTLALFATSEIYSALLDKRMEELTDDVQAAVNNDATCPKPPKNDKDWPPGPGGPGRPGRDPGARPIWIYDPSGVITDGVDPIVGATATLTRANTENGSYSVWDAENYEQVNDQVTGADGAYGWNVPEGWYVVTATAPGRVSASSAKLQVLPPRTGVDLVLAPSELAEVVTAAATGPVVTVTFDQWMRTDFLTSSQLGVTDAGGEPVTATVAPVSPRTGTDGESYARSVRLTVPAPTETTQLTVTVDDGVQDVAGRPMAEDVTKDVTITVTGPPTPPPPGPDCQRLQQAVATAGAVLVAAQAALGTAQKALTKATKKLKKLKESGAPAAKIKAAKKKVKAAKGKVKAARSRVAAAAGAAAAAATAAAVCH